jgi:hypothetical protein
MRASSTSVVEGKGVVERLKVLKRLGMNGQKKKANTALGNEVSHQKELYSDPSVNFF